jgi:F420-non-reducing hydrogenase large subunit
MRWAGLTSWWGQMPRRRKRNILGVIAKVGLEIGGKVIAARKRNHQVIEMIGGRTIHPVSALPGGMSHAITEEQRLEIVKIARQNVEFGQFSIDLFEQVVLHNQAYVDLITSDAYTQRTYYMGLVDHNNHVNFYDGVVRVVNPEGVEFASYMPDQYAQHIAEHVEPWTYLKFPYLRKVGWKGFVDGKDSGVYCATPLSRLNAADGMATSLAQAEYERMYEVWRGGRSTILWRLIGHVWWNCSMRPSGCWSWPRIPRWPARTCAPCRTRNRPKA